MTDDAEPLPSTTVLMVNYRSADLAIASLAALADEADGWNGLRAIVVDNASGDGSADAIPAAIADRGWMWARFASAPVNGGFAYGNNHALHLLRQRGEAPELLWLLNPDTRVEPGAARTLARFMRDHPRAGIAGSAIRQEDGSLWPYAFRFPSILGEAERAIRFGPVSRLLARSAVLRAMGDVAEPVEWVSGASMIVRRRLFETAGPMDEDYFLYFEETDFCLQARRAGWECWYVPDAVVTHLAGRSTGVTDPRRAPARIPRYWFESRRRYFVKNHGRGYAVAADAAWALGHLLWRGRRLLQRQPDPDPPALLRDFVAQSALLRRAVAHARRPA